MNVTNGRCGSVAGAQQLIFIYRDVADRRHVRFVKKNVGHALENHMLLFTPFTVTRFAMHRNHAFA